MNNIEILKEQENLLMFERFTNNDGYTLGKQMAQYLQENGLNAAAVVRSVSGYTLFAYGPDGTSLLNQIWVDKKFETVKIFGKSSLRCWFEADVTGQSIHDHGLEKSCAFAPGAFPIHVKGVGVVAVISISGLEGLSDHDVVVKVIAGYLGIDMEKVPMLSDAV